MIGRICVFSSSSDMLEEIYFRAARELGRLMAENGMELVYGGGAVGLMGACADEIRKRGGRITGVIPEALHLEGVVYPHCDRLHVTRTMRERKALMEESADAFVALPGGYGTLEELLEIITLKQLGYHTKPIVIINTDGFYDLLLGLFDRMIAGSFAKEESRRFYQVVKTPQEVFPYLETYQPAEPGRKWFDKSGSRA